MLFLERLGQHIKMIAIIVPCLNEEKRMDTSRWQTIVNSSANCHWVFVNDGSLDRRNSLNNELTAQNLPNNYAPLAWARCVS